MKDHELIFPTLRSKVDELERGTVNVFNVNGVRLPPELETKIEDTIVCISIEVVYSKNPHHQSVTITNIVRTVQERPGPSGMVEKTWTTYREIKDYRVRDGVDSLNDDLWNKLCDHYKPAVMKSRWHATDVAMSAEKEAEIIVAVGQG